MKLESGIFYDGFVCSLENNDEISVSVGLKIFDDGFDIFINPYKSWNGKFFEYGVLVNSIQACRHYIYIFFEKLESEEHLAHTVVNGIKIQNVVPDLVRMCVEESEFIKVNP